MGGGFRVTQTIVSASHEWRAVVIATDRSFYVSFIRMEFNRFNYSILMRCSDEMITVSVQSDQLPNPVTAVTRLSLKEDFI